MYTFVLQVIYIYIFKRGIKCEIFRERDKYREDHTNVNEVSGKVNHSMRVEQQIQVQ